MEKEKRRFHQTAGVTALTTKRGISAIRAVTTKPGSCAIVALLLGAGFFLFFRLQYSYHLFFAEQIQLFMFTGDYFLNHWQQPGALASWSGEFLTQFHYLEGGGPLVTALLLTIAWRATHGVFTRFARQRPHLLLALFPVILLFSLYLDLLYTHAATLSFLTALGAFLLLSGVTGRPLRRSLLLLMVPVVYLLAGSGLFLFMGLSLLYELLHARDRNYSLWWYVPLVAGGTVALVAALRLPYRLTWEQAFLLPLSGGNHRELLWGILGLFVILPAAVLSAVKFRGGRPGKVVTTLFLTLLAGISLFGALRIRGEFRVEKILAIDSHLYFNKPEEAARLARKYNPGSSAGAYYYNLAHSYAGEMPWRFHEGNQTGPDGLFLPVDNRQSFLSILFSNEVYYHLGDVNASQHSAMLGMIFSPQQQSSRLLRRLAQINIINGEYEVAAKFLAMLDKSLFHRKWALTMRQLLYDEALCRATPWVSEKRELQPYSMELKGPNDHETSLRLLLERQPANAEALHYLLCLHLMKKDVAAFGETFFRYIGQVNQDDLPEIYQQALLILYATEKESYPWQGVGITPEVAAAFGEYSRIYGEEGGDGTPLRQKFGKSYWFYYHYAHLNAE